MSASEGPFIWVRRQYNDPLNTGKVLLQNLEGVHWDTTSGGVNATANRPYLHGYVYCNEFLEGGVAHSCTHGPPPHRIKVCLVKKDNDPAIMAKLMADVERRAEWARLLRARYGMDYASHLIHLTESLDRCGEQYVREHSSASHRSLDKKLAEIRAAGVPL